MARRRAATLAALASTAGCCKRGGWLAVASSSGGGGSGVGVGVSDGVVEGVPEGVAGIDGVRFRRPVVPGDQLLITCELLSLKRRRFGKVHATATVEGERVCSGELMFSLVD